MRQQAFLFLICALTFSGCGVESSGRYGLGYQSGSNSPTSLGPNGPAPGQARQAVAILLPMTGPRADLGQVLLQATHLALQDDSGLALDVLDTGGTAAGAASAAQAAVSHGDGLILGPLTSPETSSVAPVARQAGIPVLAFTNDASQSQPGVWPLGISPGQQIRRLVVAAQAQGKSQFAGLLPDTDFGRAIATALMKATETAGLQAPNVKMHPPGMPSITAAARDLSGYANRRGPIDAKVKAARALGTADGRREAQELARTSIPPPSFDVLLLGDTGDALQEIAAVLPYYDVDRSVVQIIGPALWSDPSSGSGAVQGAWYAAPDSSTRSNLERDYAAKYGVPPPPLADLAYDSASIAKVILGPKGSDIAILTQPGGFVGTDGWFALLPDGQVRRGLAVYRIQRGGPELIDPAPQSAGTPGL
ncbi:MAG: penicillin-binding protein activator [Rhodopila sp.]|jgi:branched-chain amino acid transport system substrate-binding protein|nr:penicillin-binding protein activator [Rhodopila sp.]